MKARFSSGLGDFEVEASEIKDLFRQLAVVQEVFGAETRCGVCRSEAIRCQHRKVDDYDFYELVCMAQGCRARFSFGQAKKGGALFPKRKDEDGHWLKNGGWEKYVPQGEAREPEPPRQQDHPAPTGGYAPGAGTDAKTQDRYNRLAQQWGFEKAPVRFADFVTMAREHFGNLTKPSTTGVQEFDKLYRRYMFEHANDSLHPQHIAAFMTECYEAANLLNEVPY